jgi:hypothetical protein
LHKIPSRERGREGLRAGDIIAQRGEGPAHRRLEGPAVHYRACAGAGTLGPRRAAHDEEGLRGRRAQRRRPQDPGPRARLGPAIERGGLGGVAAGPVAEEEPKVVVARRHVAVAGRAQALPGNERKK